MFIVHSNEAFYASYSYVNDIVTFKGCPDMFCGSGFKHSLKKKSQKQIFSPGDLCQKYLLVKPAIAILSLKNHQQNKSIFHYYIWISFKVHMYTNFNCYCLFPQVLMYHWYCFPINLFHLSRICLK